MGGVRADEDHGTNAGYEEQHAEAQPAQPAALVPARAQPTPGQPRRPGQAQDGDRRSGPRRRCRSAPSRARVDGRRVVDSRVRVGRQPSTATAIASRRPRRPGGQRTRVPWAAHEPRHHGHRGRSPGSRSTSRAPRPPPGRGGRGPRRAARRRRARAESPQPRATRTRIQATTCRERGSMTTTAAAYTTAESRSINQ